MKTHSKQIFWWYLKISIFSFLVLIISGCNNDEIAYTPTVNTIDNVETDTPIVLAIAANNDRYHLIWSSKDKGVNYQHATYSEKISWTDVNLISSEAAENVAIASEKDNVYLFWYDYQLHYYQSRDGGNTWEDYSEILDPLEGSVEHLSVLTMGGVVHLLFGNQNNLYYRRGEQKGTEWQDTQILASSQSYGLSSASFSLSPDGSLYVVWANYDSTLNSQGSTIFEKLSVNGGLMWQEDITVFSITDSMITQPTISVSNDVEFIAWLSEGKMYYLEQRNQKTSPNIIKEAWPVGGKQKTITSILCNHNTACLFWIDRRNVHKEWWTNIPMHQVITWDTDPYWSNNDLYMKSVAQQQYDLRLTPDLSYVFTNDAATGNEELIVVWSGKVEVGKTLDGSGKPYQIFWTQIKESP